MAVLEITDSADTPNVAQIDVRTDQQGSGHAKWKCRTPGAFCDRLTLDEWQEATVKWFTNSRDQYASTVSCNLDVSGDGEPLPCLELEDVYNNGVHVTGLSGTGRIIMSRAGVMTEGDITWKSLGF